MARKATAPLSDEELTRAQAEARALLPDDPAPTPELGEGSAGGDTCEGEATPSTRPHTQIAGDLADIVQCAYLLVQLVRTRRSLDFEPNRGRPADLANALAPKLAHVVAVKPALDTAVRWVGLAAGIIGPIVEGELTLALKARARRQAEDAQPREAVTTTPPMQVLP